MPLVLERSALPRPSLREILGQIGPLYAVNGLIGFIFAATGPVAVVLSVGTRGGLSEAQLASWIFGSFFLNGLLTLLMTWVYRTPLVFFWTIPGTVLVGPALDHLNFAQVLGAFYATGLLMALLGLSGWVRRAMAAIPMPIVMAMVAGVFLKFGLNLVTSFKADLLIAAPMTLVFLVLSAWPALGRKMPPLIGALLVGAVVVLARGQFDTSQPVAAIVAQPVWITPQWSWQAMVELVVPLAITVLAAQNAQGFAVLTSAGHAPPVNAVTTACGVWSMLTATVGTVSTCLTGPTNAIVVAGGERERHYTGALVAGALAIGFGLLSPLFTRWLLATPAAFIAVLAGLAMLRVLQSAFVTAFKERHTLGALVTFLVTVADVSILNIGAPFWGLVFGFVVSWWLERTDFNAARQ